MRVGIVGLPNAGKSTLFNALSLAGAETASYPFTTVEPNVAVVPVPDHRLGAVGRTLAASHLVHETIELHDIAGLVRGASTGEGLGNRFLAEIRETDAICHVVRCHSDDQVAHPEGRVDPGADIDTVQTELLYADLEHAERRLERVVKAARSGDRDAVAEQSWLQELVEALGAGRPARSVPVPPDMPAAAGDVRPLTAKPVLYVANVDEGTDEVPEPVARHARESGAEAVAVSARIEAELAELEAGEAAAMRAELGAAASGLERLIRGARRLLDLITFLTGRRGEEVRAWSLERGLTAWHAAGRIHTDMQQGFVRAEVIPWDALVESGGYAGARERGILRLEGRDYVVQDGDVLTIKHTA